MITYLIQVILFQVAFLAVYDFFLSKETFHNNNRWYLLGTPIVSFVLPLIKIPTLQKAVPEELMVYLPEVVLSPQKVIEQSTYYSESSINYVSLLFWVGAVIFFVVFLVKLYKIVRLIYRNEMIHKKGYKLILLPKKSIAFSFFKYIFLGKAIPTEKQEDIIKHELIHAEQKHSLDLLFFELLRVIMWFNPMVYIYQHRITLLHEYISDAEVVKTTHKKDYFNKLLSQTFEVENISFVNQFYKHSFIKKRITMMTKNKSKQVKKVKYLLLLPMLLSMLIYTSCDQNQIDESDTVELDKSKFSTVKSVDNLPYFIMDEVELDKGNKNKTGHEFHSRVRSLVLQNFNSAILKDINLSKDRFKIYSVFDVNTKGEIENIKIRAPHPKLKEETERVLNLLPTLVPAKKDGKFVAMRYTLPISYKTGKSNKDIKAIDDYKNDVPFAIIEEVPVYPGCTGTREEKAACLNMKIKKFVVKNFNINVSKSLGLPKGRKKIWVVFRIDKEGNVVDVNARAPHPKLKEEAERLAKMLPKMVPGKQRGKPVGMKYTLPISFNIE
jgi:beta-lactamase regulating signal transducer with metallopeptidase domain